MAPGYLRATSLLTGIGWPFFIYIGAIAYSAIRFLYGEQWMPAVPLAQILCLVAILELTYGLATEVMIAAGRIDQSNRLQFRVQSLRLASLVLVFPFGLSGVCWGLGVAAVAGALISHAFLHQIIGLRFKDVFRACLPSGAVGILAGGPSLLVALSIEQSEANYLAVFVGCSAATGITWLLALKLCRHPLWNELLLIIDRMRKRPKAA